MSKDLKIMATIGALVIAGGALLLLSNKPSAPFGDAPVPSEAYRTGNSDARVTIVEFGDYQCGACAVAHPIIKQVISQYQPSELSFVFRHFPLQSHRNAMVAAQSAEAAGEQGKYWEMHDKIYEKQDEWAENARAFEIMQGYASELGLDMDKFKQAVEQERYKEKILADQSEGLEIGINATPTFFINGEPFVG